MEVNVESNWESQGYHPQYLRWQIKTTENVEYLNYFGSMINDVRCTREMKCNIAMTKAAFNKKALFTSKLDVNWRKKPVKCYIWITALCGAGTWTLRTVYEKYLVSLEMWCWRRMEKISWIDRVGNEVVLHGVEEYRNALYTKKKKKEEG